DRGGRRLSFGLCLRQGRGPWPAFTRRPRKPDLFAPARADQPAISARHRTRFDGRHPHEESSPSAERIDAMTASSAPLALTMGEPGGVGPEIALAAWRALRPQGPVFFLIADPALFDSAAIRTIISPDEAAAVFPAALPV